MLLLRYVVVTRILLELSHMVEIICFGRERSAESFYFELKLIVEVITNSRIDLGINLKGRGIVMIVYLECDIC